jgi:putative oxidoreductase
MPFEASTERGTPHTAGALERSQVGGRTMSVIATLLYDWPCAVAARLAWLAPLLARVTVGWVFAMTGWGKLHSLQKVIDYFTDLGIPYPQIQAPFASANEFVCGVLVLLGLATRVASIPLIVVMLVAIRSAQWENVDSAAALFGLVEWLYIAIFAWLAIAGPGPVSLDALIARALKRSRY